MDLKDVTIKWDADRLVKVKRPVFIEVDTNNKAELPLSVKVTDDQREEVDVVTTVNGDNVQIEFTLETNGYYHLHITLDDFHIPGSPFSCYGYGAKEKTKQQEKKPEKNPKIEAPTHWKKGKKLGRGGFGTVYLGYDEDTGRELAVKRVLVDTGEATVCSEVTMLEHEISILKHLANKRIVKYFGSKMETERGDDDTFFSIFMEYVPGGSIKDLMASYKGPLTERVTAKYTAQVVEGLMYLHRENIIHRDIKCANILRKASGNIKLGDFGASKHLTTICTLSAGTKTLIGTMYWISPEMINGEKYNYKTDIWSLGCAVVEMMTTHPPFFETKDAPAIIKKIISDDPPEYELPADVSDSLKDFLEFCFVKDQKKRSTAEELSQHTFLNLMQ